MMFFLSDIIFVVIPILKAGHFSCLFARCVSIKVINIHVRVNFIYKLFDIYLVYANTKMCM